MARRRGKSRVVGHAGPTTGGFGGGMSSQALYASNQAGWLKAIEDHKRATGATGGATGHPAPEAPRVPDWQENLATLTANRNVALSNAQAQYQTGQINRDFGYTAQGGIDPTNPYSRAALLEQSYRQGQLGNTNSYASQGQLYSGALQNARNETTRGYNIDKNSLQNQYQDALQGVSLGQLQTYANSGSAVSDASFQALLAALGRGR